MTRESVSFLLIFTILARIKGRKVFPCQAHEKRHGLCNPLVFVMGADRGDTFPGKVAFHRPKRAVRQLPLHGEAVTPSLEK